MSAAAASEARSRPALASISFRDAIFSFSSSMTLLVKDTYVLSLQHNNEHHNTDKLPDDESLACIR